MFSRTVVAEHFAQRTALKDLFFFLPYLKAGMRLLDCGCGPGTISVDLAQVIAPGELSASTRTTTSWRWHARTRGTEGSLAFASSTRTSTTYHSTMEALMPRS